MTTALYVTERTNGALFLVNDDPDSTTVLGTNEYFALMFCTQYHSYLRNYIQYKGFSNYNEDLDLYDIDLNKNGFDTGYYISKDYYNIKRVFKQIREDRGRIIVVSVNDSSKVILIDEDRIPLSAPIATAATLVATTSFSANWNVVSGALGYYLYVYTDSSLSTVVTGYNGLDVGNVLTKSVTGLTSGNYYYVVKAYNNQQTSNSSNTITLRIAFNDWFLPSKDEVNEFYTEVYLHGLGGLSTHTYWSSSEQNFSSAWYHNFGSGAVSVQLKSYALLYTRAIRSFSSAIPYSVRDVGQGGGIVFWKSGNDYLEVAPYDITGTPVWSNIDGVAIGTTGTAIGTGQTNTTAIIGQQIDYSDWFLPSLNELSQMYIALKAFAIGNFADYPYWSSSENSDIFAETIEMRNGSNVAYNKALLKYVRACRSFTSTTIYSLRDVGPAGGWIFYIIDNGDSTYTYLEAAPSDQSSSQRWSNIGSTLIGTTSEDIGEGQNNTNEIIAQAGHTASAAKLCDDCTITIYSTDSAAKLCDDLSI